ncbi:MAG: hypothetical protein U5Q03_05525 [Bacteroidota bacterium]|nr:hypothetical protein [Bacteroidota bacterium]
MPYRFVIIIFFLGFAIQFSYSQQTAVVSETKKKAYTFINRPYPDSLEYNTSMIIQEIALANNQRKSDVTFSLNYELSYKIEANRLFIRIGLLSLAGNTRYMNFGVGEKLYPSHARLQLSLKKDRYISKRFELPAIALDPLADWIRVPIEEELLEGAELVFSGISFYFDERSKNSIFSHFELINDYYGSSLATDSLINLSFRYKLENALYLPTNLDFLLLLTKTREKLRNKEFLDHLPLELYDPAAYLAKLDQLDRRLNRTRTLSLQMLSREQSPNISADLVFNELLSLTRRLIEWSGRTDHYFQQSFYELAIINYVPEDFSLQEQLTSYSREEMGCIFMEKQLALADTYISSMDYTTAYDLLQSLLAMTSATTHCACIVDITEKLSGTASKIYDSYLRVSEKAIETNNFDFGIEYLNKAKNFLEQNAGQVHNGARLNHIQEMLAKKYYSELNRHLKRHDYEKALNKLNELKMFLRQNDKLQLAEFDYGEKLELIREGLAQDYLSRASHLFNQNDFEQAREYLRKAENVKKTDAISGTLHIEENEKNTTDSYTIRESLISKGLQALKAQKTREAHDLFLEARKKSERHHLNRRIDSLIMITSEKLIEQSIINFRVALFQGRLETAEGLLDEIEEYYRLSGNAVNSTEIEKLRNEFSKSGCEASWKKYETNTLKGFKAIDSSNFTLAVSFFEVAIEMMPNLDECGFSDSIALKAKTKYSPAAAYQLKYDHVKSKLFQSGFSAVIEDYILLDSFYLDRGLEAFKMERYRIGDFLRQQQNPILYLQAIEYLNGQKNCTAALAIFSELTSTAYPCRKTRDIQKEMAEVCYRKDKSKGTDFLPDEDLIHHTRNRNCMQFFKKRYNYLVNRDDIMSIFKKDTRPE